MTAERIENGIYFIQNVGTGTVIDLAGASAIDGAKLQGFAKRDLNDDIVGAQLWYISHVGNEPVYTIRNIRSLTYADLYGFNAADGTPIVGFHGTGGQNQHWVFISTPDKKGYNIRNVATGTFIDLYAGGPGNCTPINGWTGLPSMNQVWRLISI
ncbi:ricin B-like lectin [Irpex rosettiformis]|uniref:Ricin B-like lectin n=1 Tax=Irpex rosettiformis TaxID=378272 RepID=A0ACB8U8H9_9APHY|nr:ricin B-like lectin [Irpex rosettiformis]